LLTRDGRRSGHSHAVRRIRSIAMIGKSSRFRGRLFDLRVTDVLGEFSHREDPITRHLYACTCLEGPIHQLRILPIKASGKSFLSCTQSSVQLFESLLPHFDRNPRENRLIISRL
jgi:hypothetical protein